MTYIPSRTFTGDFPPHDVGHVHTGCTKCPICHPPQMIDMNYGELQEVKDLLKRIVELLEERT